MDVAVRILVIAVVGFWAGGLVHENPLLVTIPSAIIFAGATELLTALRVWPASSVPLLFRMPAIALVMFPAVQLGNLILQTPSPFLLPSILRGVLRTLGTLGLLGIAILVARLETQLHPGWAHLLDLDVHYRVMRRLTEDPLFWRLTVLTVLGYSGDGLVATSLRSSAA